MTCTKKNEVLGGGEEWEWDRVGGGRKIKTQRTKICNAN